MKEFTNTDVRAHTVIEGAGKLFASTDELVYCPLDWQKRGLQQTATGYGAKLTSSYKINFEGKLYRLYVTCYGNAGSTWFRVKGRTIYVS